MAEPSTTLGDTGDWAPVDFERHGRELLASLREHFEHVRDVPVARPYDPAGLMARLDTAAPERGEDFSRILADTWDQVVPDLVQWNHPAFHGYFSTCASFPGVLAETMTAALNVNAMLWKTSPSASALELVVLRWLADMAGYPADADAVLVGGASLATLYALGAARDAAYPHDVREHGLAGPDAAVPRIYTSDQAHSSVDKAAITLGVGLRNVVRIPSDSGYRMRPDLLEAAIAEDVAAGRRPVAVVATVGTTSVAAADPLGPIADICRRHGVWLHVDAAYGGLFALSTALRPALEDVSVGDSLVVNPQKTLFVPLDATSLHCRRRGALANTYRLVPEYLTSAHPGGAADFMDLSPQLGRGFRALKLWWVIRAFGLDGLRSRLDHAVALAGELRGLAAAHPDWHCPVPSDYPLVCLRYQPSDGPRTDTPEGRAALDALNARIVAELNDAGEAFVSHSVIRDGYVIRVSLANIHTTADDITRLWAALNRVAEKTR
ncbi:pyridoxal-dependent decarboxylase [Streptomyces violaceochromogenes]|uniref:Pyridoxal-dependent decarboxylase n=1 Tax=Streptomyces violaceochromogenes TaxID=67377 RepID=A0ABU6M860_9ACTN|nr:pyridoxal-dependent decarboxylase [Streptomyces violaceochromogenes]MEC7057762.1 pyridoxal-dependent decarboxylase [Streptomyces violaceochromogenes]GHC52265.1 aromatic-L-amino-acid decarboxylase [Streptomyces violaceochromogenes]